ncbi:MAG: hypothetical protein HZA37_02335 [Parcubacteria group bacterium]|nr:hypothetical protein [Parcubacteria group bacterium]
MEERSRRILERSVEEFIRTGRPVSSDWLYERHDFGIKPAAIRMVLNDLTMAGWLIQPHVSGGRVPSDRAYAFFAERILGDAAAGDFFADGERIGDLADDLLKGEWEPFVSLLSRQMKSLGALYVAEKEEIFKKGLDELIKSVDFPQRGDLREIISDFENISERMKKLTERLSDDFSAPRVFIGKNFLTRSSQLAVIVDACVVDGARNIIAVVGSKKMDYKKNIKSLIGMKRKLSLKTKANGKRR